MARSVVFRAENGRDILGVSREQYLLLDRLMRRYYHWRETGRKIDPWQSGVSGATRFDLPRTMQHRPNGHAGPGRYSEADLPTDLMRIDEVLASLSVIDNLLFSWHWSPHPHLGRTLRIHEMLEALNVTLDVYKVDWNRAKTRLYCTLCGL
jgi:hypothetical protein